MTAERNQRALRASKAREARIRRKIEAQGLLLQRSRTRIPDAPDFGTYQVVRAEDGVVVLGVDQPEGYGLTLDEIEAEMAKDPDERMATPSSRTLTPLRAALNAALAETGGYLDDVTVLAAANDPFRVDTPTGWRNARWLAEEIDRLFPGRQVHLRGMHYAVLGAARPDGAPYINTDDAWVWLQVDAAKSARWLGTVPFERIIDRRSKEPVIFEHASRTPAPMVAIPVTGLDRVDPVLFRPRVWLPEVEIQPYRLVIWSEKSSTEDVLAPIAERYRADLYLGTGEASDTLIHKMAADADADGRPVVILTVCDADPSGWQMPISIARKLQAFKVALFPGLRFQVYRVGLTPDQVRELGLPSTPLKATERRADKWRAAMGVEQTEIDALATLQPEVLAELTERAIARFFDADAEAEASSTRRRWLARTRVLLEESINADEAEELRAEVEDALSELRELEERARELANLDIDDLPAIVLPVAEPSGAAADDDQVVIDSERPFGEQTLRLISQKRYDAPGGTAA